MKETTFQFWEVDIFSCVAFFLKQGLIKCVIHKSVCGIIHFDLRCEYHKFGNKNEGEMDEFHLSVNTAELASESDDKILTMLCYVRIH